MTSTAPPPLIGCGGGKMGVSWDEREVRCAGEMAVESRLGDHSARPYVPRRHRSLRAETMQTLQPQCQAHRRNQLHPAHRRLIDAGRDTNPPSSLGPSPRPYSIVLPFRNHSPACARRPGRIRRLAPVPLAQPSRSPTSLWITNSTARSGIGLTFKKLIATHSG